MATRKQDWSPKGLRFEDEIDDLLDHMEESGATEAIMIADFMREVRADGELDRDLAIAILGEIETYAKGLRKKIERLR